jgi:signal transduction histidine kinase
MFYELGLLGTIVVGLWIAVDVGSACGDRGKRLGLVLLGAAGTIWAAGQFALDQAIRPAEIVLARRVLFAGACGLPIAWLASAAQAARAAWLVRFPWLLLVAALPLAFAYSCLYWDSQGRFVEWATVPVSRGPWFLWNAAYAWALIALGFGYFALAAARLGKAQPLRMTLLGLGVLAPLAGNVGYLLFAWTSRDPTPLLLGLGALRIRVSVIESGVSGFLPVVRRDVLQQLEAGVLVANLRGTVVDANRAAHALADGAPLLDRSLDERLDAIRRNPRRSVEIETFSLKGAVGEVGRGAVLLDRTAKRRVERQVLQSRRVESIAILAAGIAHEINNPLAYVRANVAQLEDLAKRLNDPDLRRKLPDTLSDLATDGLDAASEAREGVDRIGSLVESLRRFARERAPARGQSPVEMSKVVHRAIQVVAPGLPPGSVQMRLDRAPRVLGDEEELVQVLLKLLGNAIEASAEAPRIEVSVGLVRGGVLTSVADRGSGIADGDLPHLFDPFFTTRSPDKGTGLGLSLGFDVVRRFGGTLEGANRPGGGAIFHLWLPAYPELGDPARPT